MANTLNVGMAGVGSCASSLVQTVAMASDAGTDCAPGISYPDIGGYAVGDIKFTVAFDVDRNKIGQDLGIAVSVPPTAAIFHIALPVFNVPVEAGPVFDGLAGRLGDFVTEDPSTHDVSIDEIARRLNETRTDVLVCVLPTGATAAVRAYAKASAQAGVAFVNATPEPVVHDDQLVKAFEWAGVPLLGDDLKSHLGATALHTSLLELLASRGVEVINTYQLNVGGNMDFLNLTDPARSTSKVQSKRRALAAAGLDASAIAAGPNGFVEYLGDRKTCFLRIEARSVLGSSLLIDARLEVEDSPNAAGVLVNAVRAAKHAHDTGTVGVVDAVCALLFKSPRIGSTESEGRRAFENFVEKATPSPDR